MMKSGGFHGSGIWQISVKSSGFHEIWQISCMNPVNFMADLEKCKLEHVKFL